MSVNRRKPKPQCVYREETYDPTGYGNSTRQTFDIDQYNAWLKWDLEGHNPDWERKFYVGTIEWAGGSQWRHNMT